MLLTRLSACVLVEADVAHDEFVIDICPGIPELSSWLIDRASFYSNPTFPQLHPRVTKEFSGDPRITSHPDGQYGTNRGGHTVVSALPSLTLSRSDIRELSRRAHRALPSGGRLVVVDAMPAPTRSAQKVARQDVDWLSSEGDVPRPASHWWPRLSKMGSVEFWRTAAADAGFRNIQFLVVSPPVMVMIATREGAHP